MGDHFEDGILDWNDSDAPPVPVTEFKIGPGVRFLYASYIMVMVISICILSTYTLVASGYIYMSWRNGASRDICDRFHATLIAGGVIVSESTWHGIAYNDYPSATPLIRVTSFMDRTDETWLRFMNSGDSRTIPFKYGVNEVTLRAVILGDSPPFETKVCGDRVIYQSSNK